MTERKNVNPIDTLAITESLGLQTFRRGSRKAWTKEEDLKLIRRLYDLYPQQAAARTLNHSLVDWDKVAEVFDKDVRKGKDCKKRWTSSLDPTLRRGKWTPEEDAKLLELYLRHGAQWQQVASEIDGRTEHQCSKRYLEVLDPALRNRLKSWTTAEDLLLIRQVREHGTKWKTIAGAFDARPSLNCRNRWRNLLTAVARGRAEPAINDAMASVVGGDLDRKLQMTHEEDEEDDEMELDHVLHTRQDVPTLPPRTNPMATVAPQKAVEWKWQFSGDHNGGPLRHLESSGGHISSRELVHYLVQYASAFNMKIAVHQHLHHHYGSAESHTHSGSPAADSVGAAGLSFSQTPSPMDPTGPRTYNVEPESQSQRIQHFNYLPPLTEVPRLGSSASSPATSSKEGASSSTHHHHHHHHHHHVHGEDPASKEGDLLRLLSKTDQAKNPESRGLESRAQDPRADPDTNAMTPLTQAVQMVTAAESNGTLYGKRPAESTGEMPDKRIKTEDDLGHVFDPPPSRRVSHYSNHLDNLIDEEDEEMLQSYGLFYNSVPREPQSEPPDSEFMDIGNPFAFPFNPS